MGAVPDGDTWPPETGWSQGGGPFSAYVHVPFCNSRCGYCDFNTYVAEFGEGADRATYASSVKKEIAHSRQILGEDRPLQSVFFGGGTPTLLTSDAIGGILDALSGVWGIQTDAEITVEANPDTITPDLLQQLRDHGVNRLSVGMQSAVPHVLRTLDRTHSPEMIPKVATWARDAGLSLSFDLIYGTPGESLSDWENSLQVALAQEPDHLSVYSLILEPGTKLYAQVERGAVPKPDDDDAAEKYILADNMLAASGFQWYEISNYARLLKGEPSELSAQPRNASKHNLAYWRDHEWWGYGPGAHSHVGNGRWWNVSHPLAYAQAVQNGWPVRAGELLDKETRDFERLMLLIRTHEGVQVECNDLRLDGLVTREGNRTVLTQRGRLMADFVTRVLAGWD